MASGNPQGNKWRSIKVSPKIYEQLTKIATGIGISIDAVLYETFKDINSPLDWDARIHHHPTATEIDDYLNNLVFGDNKNSKGKKASK